MVVANHRCLTTTGLMSFQEYPECRFKVKSKVHQVQSFSILHLQDIITPDRRQCIVEFTFILIEFVQVDYVLGYIAVLWMPVSQDMLWTRHGWKLHSILIATLHAST